MMTAADRARALAAASSSHASASSAMDEADAIETALHALGPEAAP
jgi:hypothetical protein